MITPIFFAINNNGILIVRNDKMYRQYLSKLPREVNVTVKPFKKYRSSEQNRYFHGVVLPLIADHLGDINLDTTKDLLKSMFLKEQRMIKTKKDKMKEVTVIRGSRELSTKEFEEFMSKVRMWASMELGISIPEPHEVVSI